MLQKKNRINKDKEFERIFNQGISSYSNILGVKANKNDLDYSRFGVIVSNKICKMATARNRIKRQIRGIIREEQKNIKTGYDIIIIAQLAIIKKERVDIYKDLFKHFKKLRLIK